MLNFHEAVQAKTAANCSLVIELPSFSDLVYVFLDLAAPKSHMDDHYLTSRHVQQSQSLLKYTHIIGGILSIVTKISVCSFRLSQIILISCALIVLYYTRRYLRIQLETDLEAGRVTIPRHLQYHTCVNKLSRSCKPQARKLAWWRNEHSKTTI